MSNASGDKDDFKKECEARLIVGYAWLGQKCGEIGLESVPDCDLQTHLMSSLAQMQFPILSQNTLRPEAIMNKDLESFRSLKTLDDVEHASKEMDHQNKLLAELHQAIKVSVTDLKKSTARREKEKKKAEVEAKKKKDAQEKQQQEAAAAEYKRSMLLSQLSIPFTMEGKDVFATSQHRIVIVNFLLLGSQKTQQHR